MTQKVGGIEFDVTVDANGVATGRKAVATDLSAIESSFDKIDKSSKKFSQTTEKTGAALGGMGRNAGMAGIQVQQFVGQIQGGQSALLALSQQSADLGFVLGHAGLGAAVGIAATAISFLMMDTENAASAVDRLEESMQSLEDITSVSSDGIRILSDDLRKLAEYSEQAAKAKITLGLIQAKEAAEAASDAINESFDSLDADYGLSGISDFVAAINSANTAVASGATYSDGFKETARELGEEFGFAGKEAQSLGSDIIQLIAQVQRTPSPEGFEKLNQALLNAQASAPKASESINRLIGEAQEFFAKARTAAESTEFLEGALTNLGGALGKSSELTSQAARASQELKDRLQAQVIAMESGAQAAEVYAAAQRAVRDGTQDQLPSVIELINRKYELKSAQEAAAQASREEASAYKEQEASYREFLKATEEGEAIKAAKEEGATNTLDAFKQSLMTEEQLRAEAYLRELEQFQEAAETLGLSKSETRELEKQNAQQHADELLEIEKKKADAEKALEDKKKRAKIQALGQTFSNLSSLMNTESRKLFEIGKASAMASAVVNAYQSITKTMAETPYPYNIPLAAAQAVAAFAQVKQIQSTQFGSANAAAGQSYSGGTVANNTTQAQPEQRNVSIALTGSSFTGGDIRTLIGQINEELGDGVTLSANGG